MLSHMLDLNVQVISFKVLVENIFLFICQASRDDEDKLDFKGGNVHIITTKEGWDQKIAEANRDGKTVSNI